MTRAFIKKKLWMMIVVLCVICLPPSASTSAQWNMVAKNHAQVVFIANATRQTIDRIELGNTPPYIQSIEGVGIVNGLQLAGDLLYSFSATGDIYATQVDKSLNLVVTSYLGNTGAAGTYAGNSIHVESDGTILTSGRCGVASFTQQAGVLSFQGVRFSGENIVRLTTDAKDRLYLLTARGTVYQVPQSRDWSKMQDTGWRIPRPSGFQVDGKKLMGAIASTRAINVPTCPNPNPTATAVIQPESKSVLIPDGVSGLVQAKSGRSFKVLTMGTPLFLNPATSFPSGMAVLNGAGFIIGNRTDQQPGSELFSFTMDGTIISILKSDDEFTDVVIAGNSQ